MQFRLPILAAFLAASASAYAKGISGAEVTKHLESLTNGAKDLNSRLKSNKDSDSTGQVRRVYSWAVWTWTDLNLDDS